MNPASVPILSPMTIRPKLRKDAAEIAFSVFQQAVGDVPKSNSHTTDSEATEAKKRGKAGGLKGGPARAKALSPKKRSEIAKKANSSRKQKP